MRNWFEMYDEKKESKGDDDYEIVETDWKKSILGKAATFCTSTSFQHEVNSFRSDKLQLFRSVKSKTMLDGEHRIEFTEAFNEYQEMVESLLQTFVVENGSSIRDFYAECRDSLDGRYAPLFADHQHKWFVEMLLSWLDYAYFYDSMVSYVERSRK